MDQPLLPPDRIGNRRLGGRSRIAGDASARCYWRVEIDHGQTAIACGYGPGGMADIPRDAEVLEWLRRRDVPVPRLLAVDERSGWLLLEDLGDRDGESLLSGLPEVDRADAVTPFLEPLAAVAQIPWQSLPPWNPPLDQGYLRWELAGFELWSVRFVSGRPPATALSGWLDDLACTVARHPRTVCLRDYHLNNLMVLPDGGIRVIDVQDVLVGPDTYDLASLLGDRAMPALIGPARLDGVALQWAQRTGAARGWQDRLVETGLQRAIKVLGTFSRLVARGNPGYARWIPELAATTARAARCHGAPSEVVDSLLDLQSSGGV